MGGGLQGYDRRLFLDAVSRPSASRETRWDEREERQWSEPAGPSASSSARRSRTWPPSATPCRADVFPRLHLCAEHDARFQAIDLRWGVRDEATLDQQTMGVCLASWRAARPPRRGPTSSCCSATATGGGRPQRGFPRTSLTRSRRAFRTRTRKRDWSGTRWTRRTPSRLSTTPSRARTSTATAKSGATVERALRATLEDAVRGTPLEPSDRRKYETSATHQEIQRGALQSLEDHVFCYFRRIDFGPSRRLVDRALLKDYVNLDERGAEDDAARRRLESLKDELRRLPPENVHDYDAMWTGDKPVPITADRSPQPPLRRRLSGPAPYHHARDRTTRTQ